MVGLLNERSIDKDQNKNNEKKQLKSYICKKYNGR